MAEVTLPRYTDVPCPRPDCFSKVSQPCTMAGTSHKERRMLWERIAQVQERGEHGAWWQGRYYQIPTPLRRKE